MKYIAYALRWDAQGEGTQPYEMVASCGATLDGGIIVDESNYLISHQPIDKVYFGYLYGTEQQCQAAVNACQTDFLMVMRNAQYALNTWKKFYPKNSTVQPDIGGTIYYRGDPYIKTDGTIGQDLFLTPQ